MLEPGSTGLVHHYPIGDLSFNLPQLFDLSLLDQTNKHGRTPYQLAKARGHLRCVEFLKSERSSPVSSSQPPSESGSSTQRQPSTTLQEDQLQLIDLLVDRTVPPGLITGADKHQPGDQQPAPDEQQKSVKGVEEKSTSDRTPETSSKEPEQAASVKVIEASTPNSDSTPKEDAVHDSTAAANRGNTSSPAPDGARKKSQSDDHRPVKLSAPNSKNQSNEEKRSTTKKKANGGAVTLDEHSQAKRRPRKDTSGDSGRTEEAKTKPSSTSDRQKKKKQKQTKQNHSDRQTLTREKDNASPRERDVGSKEDKRSISKIITAGLQISPRGRRKDTEDMLERFSSLTPAAGREEQPTKAEEETTKLEKVEEKGDQSENELTENEGDATLTNLSDSDESDDEYGEKEIDYSKLDIYGFLKDGG